MTPTDRPLVSVVIPGYNEAGILEEHLAEIFAYLESLAAQYRFEVLLINDGSADDTGAIAEGLKSKYSNLRVIHHPTNFGLGQAFKTAFAQTRGDYVVTMDADLSYAPGVIGDMLGAMRERSAKLVLASAYMEGGKTTNVPFRRLMLSRIGNRMIALLTGNAFSTFTCMVRAYDGPFIRSLEPKHQGMGIMPEVVYKTMVLGGKIIEIPAHLDWTRQVQQPARRGSSMRLLSHILSTFVSGFFFRPFMLLLVPGALLLLFSIYVNIWTLVEFWRLLPEADGHLSEAAALLFRNHPATLLIGLLSLMVAVQLVSLGAISLQSKRYFEETYFQIVKLRRQIGNGRERTSPLDSVDR